MQPELPDHGTGGTGAGAGGVPPPSSPPLPPPFRADHDGLRQRQRQAAAQHHHAPLHAQRSVPPVHDTDVLRLQIQTPHADMGAQTPHTWDAPTSMTVREAKDAIAAGEAGYGRWERSGLRLVYRGRILRDDDTLGAALTDPFPTVHLVARPLSPPLQPTRSHDATGAIPNLAIPPPPASVAAAASVSPTSTPTPTAAALADCVHYLIFSAREHLCSLVDTPVIRWEETYPAPLVPRATAKAAVMSVLAPHALAGSWIGWESVFAADADDGPAMEKMWDDLGRDTTTEEIQRLWKAATGRSYAPHGEVVDVDLDRSTLALHLPALDDMAPVQLVHLVQYLRVTTMLPHVSYLLGVAQVPEPVQSATPPRPTPTTAGPAPARQAPRAVALHLSVRASLRLVSWPLIQHQLWSALRISTIVWMLTRNMSFDDPRLWLIAGCAMGWWCVEGYTRWAAETAEQRLRLRRALRRAEAAARLADPDAARARLEAVARGEVPPDMTPDAEDNPLDPGLMAAAAADAPRHVAAARRAGAAGGGRRRQAQSTWSLIADRLPLLHLSTDAEQLRLPGEFELPPRGLGESGMPASAPPLRPVPLSRPRAYVTSLLLPIYLWFVTLVPVFEARRARAIRQRERTIRAVVAEMNPRLPGGEDTDSDSDSDAPMHRPTLLPDGLVPSARKYYARVASRPEAIDWDEEREAQRAMGIPDEDEGAQEGGNMAML